MALTETTIKELKAYLDITWEDDSLDLKVQHVAERGAAYLDRLTGKTNDYEADSIIKGLLFDYVRYAQAEALEDFERNFMGLLKQQQLDAMAEAQLAEDQNAEDGG
jgi:hypothetical protein